MQTEYLSKKERPGTAGAWNWGERVRKRRAGIPACIRLRRLWHVVLAGASSTGFTITSPAAPVAPDGIRYDATGQAWSLCSGPVEYRLKKQGDGRVSLDYFGPAGRRDWQAPRVRLRDYVRFDMAGQAEGQYLRPENLRLADSRIESAGDDLTSLTLTFRHRHIPLEVRAVYTTCGDTGVLTRQLTFTNRGPTDLHLEHTPSLAWLLPGADYTLCYLHGGWGEERQLATEKLSYGTRAFGSRIGRSTDGFSPWFCLWDESRGVRYAAQLAYSGNWDLSFRHYTEQRRVPRAQQDLWVDLGLRYDFGGPGRLPPGRSIVLPLVAFSASTGDLDDIANQLHRFQRRYVMPKVDRDDPLTTQCNTFEALGRSPHIADLKRYADHAANLGLENLGTDACWIVKTPAGQTNYGDWVEDPAGFPHGIKELADYVHAKGLTFSVWLEPETVATTAPIYHEHPEWVLRHDGVPMRGTRNRVFIDFRRPEVRAWTRAVVDRLAGKIGVDWLKIDYNAEVREAFDPSGVDVRSGTVLYDHLQQVDAWLDGIRRDYPSLLIEACASGGLRFDLSMLSHSHFNWRSDVTTPRAMMQLAYGATLEFPPEASYHWMSGDDLRGHLDPKSPRGWWDFCFRAAMNGRFGIGARIDDWTPAMWDCAKANVALYKRIRGVIKGSDVYHLTPPPEVGDDPTGWMALQYVAPGARRSVVMCYRLAQSEPRRVFHLRGLQPDLRYTVTIDGKPGGSFSGRELAGQGLPVQLDAEWRAMVVELTAE